MAHRIARWTFIALLFAAPAAFAQTDNGPPPPMAMPGDQPPPPMQQQPMQQPPMQPGYPRGGGGAGIRGACGMDVARLCYGVPRGGGRIVECLMAHRGALSPPCRAELAGLRGGGGMAAMPPRMGRHPDMLRHLRDTLRRLPDMHRHRLEWLRRPRAWVRRQRITELPSKPRAVRTPGCFAPAYPGRTWPSAWPPTAWNCRRLARLTCSKCARNVALRETPATLRRPRLRRRTCRRRLRQGLLPGALRPPRVRRQMNDTPALPTRLP